MIVLPAIDILNGKCVRLFKGDYSKAEVVSENTIDAIRGFEKDGAEWIHIVDLDGAQKGEPVNKDTILEAAKQAKVNIEVGGGVRSLDAAEAYLSAGIQRVIIGSAAVKNPELVKEAVKEFGKRVAVGIDARDGMVSTEGWLETHNVRFTDLAKAMSDIGVMYIIFTDISKDGTLEGVNYDALDEINKCCKANIISSGGVRGIDDIITCRQRGLYGVIVGRSLYSGDLVLKRAVEEAIRLNVKPREKTPEIVKKILGDRIY